MKPCKEEVLHEHLYIYNNIIMMYEVNLYGTNYINRI